MKKFFSMLPLLIFTFVTASENNPYTIKVLMQEDIEPLIPFVAQLRLEAFRNYPYLYEGIESDELKTIAHYTECPNSALAVAYYNETPVGFLRGIDCMHYLIDDDWNNDVVQAFRDEGLNPEQCYYFADIIIMPEHRGNLLSPQLFSELEKHAKQCNYQIVCFLTEYHNNHPLKPTNYKSLTPMWNKLGYTKSSILGYATWQTHQIDGTIKLEKHPLIFWLKNLV